MNEQKLDKQKVKDALVSQLGAEAASTKTTESVDQDAARLDQDMPMDSGDLSQSDQAGEMRGRLSAVAQGELGGIQEVEALDVSPKTTIEPGAIVAIDGDHYLVGVPASPFECDGVTYEGMSSDSPMFEAAQGKSAGDTFDLLGSTRHIDSVD
ncbi:hypothetical protein [Mobilicoccus massiliensis]|uniref:hypothetical protein n=1 Tax=Mobilicoccus massiliensis TaxID=1522310 RepID=UPI001143263C|nr:hypothetical protein [Mobilicoccus massiliensis]